MVTANVNLEVTHLHQLLRYLRPTGRVSVRSEQVGQLRQMENTLTYMTDGWVPFSWPVTGAANLSITWNEVNRSWACVGTLFGETPHGDEPKMWFHNAARAVKLREQILKSFLQNAMTFWERYAGDLAQFQYRLGIQTVATGVMTRYEAGYCWTHTVNPSVKVYFSPDPQPVAYGVPPRARFGFFESTKLHQWSLTLENLARFRDDIASFSHEARQFCEGASACFGKEDYSDVAD